MYRFFSIYCQAKKNLWSSYYFDTWIVSCFFYRPLKTVHQSFLVHWVDLIEPKVVLCRSQFLWECIHGILRVQKCRYNNKRLDYLVFRFNVSCSSILMACLVPIRLRLFGKPFFNNTRDLYIYLPKYLLRVAHLYRVKT